MHQIRISLSDSISSAIIEDFENQVVRGDADADSVVSLVKLQLSDFRNIQHASPRCLPAPHPGRGATAAARPACWKPFHYLGLGRSFRTHLTGRVIRQASGPLPCLPQCELEGRQVPIGLAAKDKGRTQLKIAGAQAQRLADLAELLPGS